MAKIEELTKHILVEHRALREKVRILNEAREAQERLIGNQRKAIAELQRMYREAVGLDQKVG